MPIPTIEGERLDVRKVRERFGPALIKVKEDRGDVYLCVETSRLPEVVGYLKDDPELDYGYFSECLGVDYGAWRHERDLPGRFEVVYHLMSLRHMSRVFVKVSIDEGEPVPSVKHIFLGSEYPEREIQDLFGVVFSGNEATPGERFLLPDDWVGYPLRKDFPLGGEDVVFALGTTGPAVEDVPVPHAGESFEGKTGTEEVGPR